MKTSSVITIFAIMILANYNTYCSIPYSYQPDDSPASIEQQMAVQQQDTTSISQSDVWLTFRQIYQQGLSKGLSMTNFSYEEFNDLIKNCGLNWDNYLDGVFEDSIGQVDPMSTWKMLFTQGDVFSNIYFDRTDFKAACPIGFLYYVAGIDEGLRSGGAGASAKENSLTSLFLFGFRLREDYINNIEPLFYKQTNLTNN